MVLVMLFSGCATKAYNINKEADKGDVVLGLDYRDFDYAIKEIMQSLLQSGVLKKADGRKYVVTTGEIVNDTTQRIDGRQLMSSIEEQLMTSGQIDVTSVIGDSIDPLITDTRAFRDSDEFNKDTLMAKGRLVAPELSFSGKIFEREISYNKKTKQVEYYIQLIVTDLKTGLRFWQKQVQVLKRGSSKTPLW